MSAKTEFNEDQMLHWSAKPDPPLIEKLTIAEAAKELRRLRDKFHAERHLDKAESDRFDELLYFVCEEVLGEK
jgi:hypothetical protein